MPIRQILLAGAACACVAGCKSGGGGGAKTMKPEASEWSALVRGLRARLGLPAGPQRAGAPVTARLWFKNDGAEKARIYLIRSEAFRFPQSTLELPDRSTSGGPAPMPPPRPHGYVVTEKDFHLIEPGAEARFEQTLATRGLKSGKHRVVWSYSNSITKWAGGAQTLDGPTKRLFGGKEIPFIWTGTVKAESVLEIE
jgi:hypothetical protein